MRPIRIILLLLALGMVVSLAIAGLCAQFNDQPMSSMSYAQRKSLEKIFKEPNPTPPIWPSFRIDGVGVSIVGDNSDELSTQVGKPYFRVSITAGWPLRCLEASTQYTQGWSDAAVLGLWTRREMSPGGKIVRRELPLEPIWMGLVVNAVLYATTTWLALAIPLVVRRHWRFKRNCCGRCGYPIGASSVCTECGARLPRG